MQPLPTSATAENLDPGLTEELRQAIALLGRVARNEPAKASDPKYLTVQDAAAYCRVAVQTIYNNRKHISRMRGVRKLLFTREALDAWLAGRPRRK